MTASRPVALLVGAGDAIGAAVARRFAAGGLQVCVARRDAAKAKPLIDEVAASGGTLQAFSVDARQEAAVQDLFAKVERDVGPIEVCLYNAGSNVNTPLLETTETLFRKSWELACYGGFLTGREAARHMVPRGHGTILFTGATASVRGGAGFAAFASAKFGLRAVAQSMARELGPKNLHVAHVVIDGMIDNARTRSRMAERVKDLPADGMLATDAIAELFWQIHAQPRSAWTFEADLRPYAEKF
jgi:NAD(P)-dependent dehydrogenase (short-subunit alcohol dehydrogenase family)